jgi:HEAT repeat protein
VPAPEPLDRASRAAAAGARGRYTADEATELAALASADADPRVRAAALAALVRGGPRAIAARVWSAAAHDAVAAVRRRAAETAPALGRAVPTGALVRLLRDADPWVAEAAAFALGEHPGAGTRALDALVAAARTHPDPLVRETAVAALGAHGDPRGLPAVLDACTDRPAVRRRAVVALAAFDGPEVEAALAAALTDRDPQVREAAEILARRRDTG